MSSNSSSTKVLAIAELLEEILLHLPLNQILVVQRVCRFWRIRIEQTSKIQKVLFLKPLSDDVITLCEYDINGHRVPYGAPDAEMCGLSFEQGGQLVTPLSNPLIDIYIRNKPKAYNLGQIRNPERVWLPRKFWQWMRLSVDYNLGHRKMREASIYRMLPTQPPTRTTTVLCPIHDLTSYFNIRQSEETVKNSGNLLRLKDVSQNVVGHCSKVYNVTARPRRVQPSRWVRVFDPIDMITGEKDTDGNLQLVDRFEETYDLVRGATSRITGWEMWVELTRRLKVGKASMYSHVVDKTFLITYRT